MQRRALVLGAGALLAVRATPAAATPERMQAAIHALTAGVPITEARVSLDLPRLVENGNTVPLLVSVQSPVTAADHVRAIHVFNEKNPQPHVFSAQLGPRNGRAVIGTRIRLGDSQRVIAIAQTADGRFWSASVDVIVTLAACLEGDV